MAGTQYSAYVSIIDAKRPETAAQFRSGMLNKALKTRVSRRQSLQRDHYNNTVIVHTRTKDDTAPDEAIKLTWGESTTGATQFEM